MPLAWQDEITFAYDRGKYMIPVNADKAVLQSYWFHSDAYWYNYQEYGLVLLKPENYVNECEDIEIRAPKVAAMLQRISPLSIINSFAEPLSA